MNDSSRRFTRQRWATGLTALVYQNVLKRLFFLLDPEFVHNEMTSRGELLGRFSLTRNLFRFFYGFDDPSLKQEIAGVRFDNPVGLSAGFDYEAKLTQILGSLDFGFQTVGTITNLPYEGNPKPRLGRLPRSKSLMVNKGFKNIGAQAIIRKLESLNFPVPVGISIGKTNLPQVDTVEKGIADIVEAFRLFESSAVRNLYYELNISCPNLGQDVDFYNPKNLEKLLASVDKLKIQKPVFVKMPISKSDEAVLDLLDVIVKHEIAGVIFGNLQTDRSNPALFVDEVARFDRGNFSGKPTEARSNQLISLAYRNYGNKLVIIGCGGIFSAQDAYTKIKLGASLVQLITGMIYQGPQLISLINLGLVELMKKDGYQNISEVIGVDSLIAKKQLSGSSISKKSKLER